jgi:hypothetical protein
MSGQCIACQRKGGKVLHLRKPFFSEEKKQKTFTSCASGTRMHELQRHKSFLVLFFKKEHSYVPLHTGARFSAKARAPSN